MNASDKMSLSEVIQCMSGQADIGLQERLRLELKAFDQEGNETPSSIPMESDASLTEPRYWVRPRPSRARTNQIGRVLRNGPLRIATAASIILTFLYFGSTRWLSQPTKTPVVVHNDHAKVLELERLNRATVDHFNLMTDQARAKIEKIIKDDTLVRAIEEQNEAIVALSSSEQSRSYGGGWQQAPDPNEIERRRQDVRIKTDEAIKARAQRAEALGQIVNLLKTKPHYINQRFLSYDDFAKK
jgi:hypothetical protein